MYVKIEPVGKPRQTRSDAWKQRPAVVRYRAFADELRLKYPYPLPTRLYLEFYIPMPKSWSKEKQAEMRYEPHQQKPDIDNLCKAVMDALADDDSYVYALSAQKFWSDEGGIHIFEGKRQRSGRR